LKNLTKAEKKKEIEVDLITWYLPECFRQKLFDISLTSSLELNLLSKYLSSLELNLVSKYFDSNKLAR